MKLRWAPSYSPKRRRKDLWLQLCIQIEGLLKVSSIAKWTCHSWTQWNEKWIASYGDFCNWFRKFLPSFSQKYPTPLKDPWEWPLNKHVFIFLFRKESREDSSDLVPRNQERALTSFGENSSGLSTFYSHLSSLKRKHQPLSIVKRQQEIFVNIWTTVLLLIFRWIPGETFWCSFLNAVLRAYFSFL